MSKHPGQALINRLAAWFGQYLYTVDPDLPLVLALWGVGSWVFSYFYAFPYLVVSAPTKGAGKSRVLELLKQVTRNPFFGVGPTPAFVLREASRLNCQFTLLWDEAEAAAASDSKSFFSEVMNSGYRRGQEIGRAKGASDTVRYPSYFPKAFALIGDPTGTIRDRSIIAEMTRGNAARDYMPEIAEREGAMLKREIERLFGIDSAAGALVEGEPASAFPSWLDTRDREVWGAMFGLAEWLKLDKSTMDRLARFAVDNVGSKLAPKRKATSIESEEVAIAAMWGERALRDLASVFRPGEEKIQSVEAIDRMKQLLTSPWRTFKGVGLSAILLADLVRPFGVRPRSFQVGSRKDKTREIKTGYHRGDVFASLPAPAKAKIDE